MKDLIQGALFMTLCTTIAYGIAAFFFESLRVDFNTFCTGVSLLAAFYYCLLWSIKNRGE